MTAWADRIEFPIMSNYGFLKWDILGVNSLNKQQMCVDLIEQYYGETVEPNDLAALRNPYDDRAGGHRRLRQGSDDRRLPVRWPWDHTTAAAHQA